MTAPAAIPAHSTKPNAASADPKSQFTRLDWAILIVIVAAALIARALPGPRTIDDAFITFRYSMNIVAGNGFVYNPGVHSLGTTTPLFTLIMAGIAAVLHGSDYPNYAIVVSAIADAGTCALLFWLGRRVLGNRWPGALIGFLWAIAPISVTFAVGGMETSVEIFWTVAAVACFVTDRSRLMAVCIAFGFLTRVDALAWIGPLLAFDVYQRWRRHQPLPWRTWLIALAITAPWLIFGTAYFGSPLSDTIAAKLKVYDLPPGSAALSMITWFATPFQDSDTFGADGVRNAFILDLALCAIGFIALVRREPRLLPWLIYPVLYGGLFVLINPLIFRWYMAPFILPYIFAIVSGAWSLLQAGRRSIHSTSPRRVGSVIFTALALLWIGLSINGWERHPVDLPSDRPAPRLAWHALERTYAQMIMIMRDRYAVTPNTRIAAADIGTVGYYSGADIIDTLALVTPNLIRYYPADPSMVAPGVNYVIPPRLILDQQPDYVLTMEGFVRDGLQKDPTFNAEYKLVEKLPFEFYGTGMLLYQRQNAQRAIEHF